MLIDTNDKLRNVDEDNFHVIVNHEHLKTVKKAKCLGVLGNELKWHKQVNGITQKVFCKHV